MKSLLRASIASLIVSLFTIISQLAGMSRNALDVIEKFVTFLISRCSKAVHPPNIAPLLLPIPVRLGSSTLFNAVHYWNIPYDDKEQSPKQDKFISTSDLQLANILSPLNVDVTGILSGKTIFDRFVQPLNILFSI